MENLIDNINNQCCVCLNIIDENDKCFFKCSHFFEISSFFGCFMKSCVLKSYKAIVLQIK